MCFMDKIPCGIIRDTLFIEAMACRDDTPLASQNNLREDLFMSNLTIKGLTEVEGMKFHCIEGGFGEGKRAMLIKEIAAIHNREVKKVNELINNNRQRFHNNIDVIDLKTGTYEGLVLQMKRDGLFTQAEIGNANNIYILSERGYSKLLKLLEDDLAWEQYEKLVEGYFALRKEFKKKRYKPISFVLRDELQAAKAISEITGVKLGIACAAAITRAEKITGSTLDDYRFLLPAADHDTGKLKVAILGEKLGGLKSTEVNKMLAEKGLQYQEIFTRKSSKTGENKIEKQWRLTENGKQYAEEFPYNRNGHSGYEIRWSESVIEFIGKVFA